MMASSVQELDCTAAAFLPNPRRDIMPVYGVDAIKRRAGETHTGKHFFKRSF
jgi:hypothetical protein